MSVLTHYKKCDAHTLPEAQASQLSHNIPPHFNSKLYLNKHAFLHENVETSAFYYFMLLEWIGDTALICACLSQLVKIFNKNFDEETVFSSHSNTCNPFVCETHLDLFIYLFTYLFIYLLIYLLCNLSNLVYFSSVIL